MTHTDERFIEDIRELLPWVANGTLAPPDRERVARVLGGAPALAAELQWLQSVRQHVQSRPTQWDTEGTLEKVLVLTRGDAAGKISAFTPRDQDAAGWSLRRVRTAMAVAASLFAAQAAVLWYVFEQRHVNDLTPAGMAANLPAARTFQITFRGNATEAAIRDALAYAKAEIVAGPGALGVYVILVPTDDNGSAYAYLRTRQDVVEQITPQKP